MKLGRLGVLLLVLYLGLDLCSPTLPGVFFLGNNTLFVDGVVEARVERAAAVSPGDLLEPPGPWGHLAALPAGSLLRVGTGPTPPPHVWRPRHRRATPPPPAPPSGLEDH